MKAKEQIMKELILGKISMYGPVKRKFLLTWCCYVYPELTDRKMRRIIMELIRDGQPIASSERGYSIIKNVRKLTEAVNYLKAKAKSLQIRANTLIGNYDQQYQDAPANLQFRLF